MTAYIYNVCILAACVRLQLEQALNIVEKISILIVAP